MKHGLAVVRALKEGLLPLAGVVALLLTGCASQPRELASTCPAASEKPTAELLFGRGSNSVPTVSEAEFRRFLSREVSPRFPDGLTVVNAKGRWAPQASSTIGDRPKLVMIVLRGGSDDQVKLEAIRTAYQVQYHQESVLLPTGPDCIALT